MRTHSSLCYVQKPFASHPQIAQRKQRHQVGRVLGQPSVLDLHEAKLALDDPKRVLHLGPDADLGLLQLLQDSVPRGHSVPSVPRGQVLLFAFRRPANTSYAFAAKQPAGPGCSCHCN